MIAGTVNALKQAVIALELIGDNGQREITQAVVDTGYDGFLAVTPDIAARLQFLFSEMRPYELSDGVVVNFPIHEAAVDWDVEALVTDGGVLVGMSLLTGYTLFIDAIDGGEVRIESRP